MWKRRRHRRRDGWFDGEVARLHRQAVRQRTQAEAELEGLAVVERALVARAARWARLERALARKLVRSRAPAVRAEQAGEAAGAAAGAAGRGRD